MISRSSRVEAPDGVMVNGRPRPTITMAPRHPRSTAPRHRPVARRKRRSTAHRRPACAATADTTPRRHGAPRAAQGTWPPPNEATRPRPGRRPSAIAALALHVERHLRLAPGAPQETAAPIARCPGAPGCAASAACSRPTSATGPAAARALEEPGVVGRPAPALGFPLSRGGVVRRDGPQGQRRGATASSAATRARPSCRLPRRPHQGGRGRRLGASHSTSSSAWSSPRARSRPWLFGTGGPTCYTSTPRGFA